MSEVDAIKSDIDIQMITRKLQLNHKHNDAYADIWSFGLQVALRISDLLALTVKEVVGANSIKVIEGKTGKTRLITLNEKAKEIVARRANDYPNDVYLFQAKGNRVGKATKAINRTTVAASFSQVGTELCLNLGTHSMRKTRGYMMFSKGVSIETISKVLAHSNTSITMRYIGLDAETISKTYEEFIL
jgi:integrase